MCLQNDGVMYLTTNASIEERKNGHLKRQFHFKYLIVAVAILHVYIFVSLFVSVLAFVVAVVVAAFLRLHHG